MQDQQLLSVCLNIIHLISCFANTSPSFLINETDVFLPPESGNKSADYIKVGNDITFVAPVAHGDSFKLLSENNSQANNVYIATLHHRH